MPRRVELSHEIRTQDLGLTIDLDSYTLPRGMRPAASYTRTATCPLDRFVSSFLLFFVELDPSAVSLLFPFPPSFIRVEPCDRSYTRSSIDESPAPPFPKCNLCFAFFFPNRRASEPRGVRSDSLSALNRPAWPRTSIEPRGLTSATFSLRQKRLGDQFDCLEPRYPGLCGQIVKIGED